MNTETTKQFTLLVFMISVGLSFLFIIKTMIEQVLPIDGVLWVTTSFWIFFIFTMLVYIGHVLYDKIKDYRLKKDEIEPEIKAHGDSHIH